MNKLFKPSTGLAIITGDSSATVISQIIDANPDIIFLKPYTLNILNAILMNILRLDRSSAHT